MYSVCWVPVLRYKICTYVRENTIFFNQNKKIDEFCVGKELLVVKFVRRISTARAHDAVYSFDSGVHKNTCRF